MFWIGTKKKMGRVWIGRHWNALEGTGRSYIWECGINHMCLGLE